ncbi:MULTISPECIES: hypothetical protein [unclassified Streptomyces]|uniref:hypothetical protein n=1 Tax=unclassified Streptomyces TaxID=2593676 RepID=UPI000DC26801|nr:hypothetical protein [Streptomyces sp. PsTaAH-137]RAJ88658.1 hypothetical protein K377_02114 [Streptomyces sp. PsTaAH-137]
MTRTLLSTVLLVLACLLVPLGTLSTWAKYEIGDSDRYVAAMAPLATQPDVQNAVADAITDGVTKNLDVGPLQSTVEGYLHDAVVSFTGTAAFQKAWNTANRAAHDAVQQAIDDDSQGPVTLDLAPVTEQVKRQLQDEGVPFAAQLPVPHTEITLLPADDLDSLRKGLHMLQVAGLWLPLAAVVFAVAGLALAVRRRRAVTATAIGMALGAGALLLALVIARALTLNDLADSADEGAAGAVYDALTATLRTASWVIVGVGLAVALASWLTGRFGLGRRRGVTRSAASGMPSGRPGGSLPMTQKEGAP